VSSNPVREQALRELEEFEAAAFRFGQQVRAFLTGLPEDLPSPTAVIPMFMGGSEPGTGRHLPGGRSYVQLTFTDIAEMAPWAALLGAPMKFDVNAPGASGRSYGTCSAEGVLDGLELYVGSAAMLTPQEWQRLQDEAARLAQDPPGGGE